MSLHPGDAAPDFTLLDQRGNPFSLRESLGGGARHLVYFYPKADTSGCIAQACGLRDVAADVGDTVIVGISPDPPERLAAFDSKHGLGFRLLSDPDHRVAEAWGCWGEKSLYGRRYMGVIRSAFLVDATGRVLEAWYKVSPRATASNLVTSLAGGG